VVEQFSVGVEDRPPPQRVKQPIGGDLTGDVGRDRPEPGQQTGMVIAAKQRGQLDADLYHPGMRHQPSAAAPAPVPSQHPTGRIPCPEPGIAGCPCRNSPSIDRIFGFTPGITSRR
jgi:hypothetical protein